MECEPVMSFKEDRGSAYNELPKIERMPLKKTLKNTSKRTSVSIKAKQVASKEEVNQDFTYSVPIEFVEFSSFKPENNEDCPSNVKVKIEKIQDEPEQYDVPIEYESNEEVSDTSNNLQDNKKPGRSRSKQKGNPNKSKRVYPEKKVHTCKECGKSYKYNSHLRYHMKIHSGEKYTCPNCDRKFNYSVNLQHHMYTHSKIKLYACNQCDRKFTWKPTLTAHIRTHTGEKPFSCTVCDKAFAQHYSFKRHMTMHSGEKPFACDLCDKTFGCKSNLNRHTKRHSGMKRHACSVCKKTFTSKHNLSKHILRHKQSDNAVVNTDVLI